MPGRAERRAAHTRAAPRIAIALAALFVAGCASAIAPVPDSLVGSRRARAESLSATTSEIAGAHGNWGRYFASRRRIEALGLASHTHSEWIDWWTPQRNLVIELPGGSEEIVYLVTSYDKRARSPFSMVTLLLNGMFDDLFSLLPLGEGAVSNATGVAVVLENAARLRQRERRYTWRVLLAGLGEHGLRGARAHLAGLSSEEKQRVRMAIDVHAPGADWIGNCVATDVAYPALARELQRRMRQSDMRIGGNQRPRYPVSEYDVFRHNRPWNDFTTGVSFNFLGGLLPQRSWFTSEHEIDVMHLGACRVDDWLGGLAQLLQLPISRVHGPRDTRSRVDPGMLFEGYEATRMLVDLIEGGALSKKVAER